MTVTGSREALRSVLEFYADPFAWKKKHDPDNLVSVPDFYSETAFGDTAADALAALGPDPAGAALTFEKIARRDIAEVVERLAYRLTPNMQCALTDAIHSLHRASPDPAGVTLTLEEIVQKGSIAEGGDQTEQATPNLSVRDGAWRKSVFTYEHDDIAGGLYYFAPQTTTPGPYLTQRHVMAIVDIASDGSFAGVELIDNMPPLNAQLSTDVSPTSDPSLQAEPLLTHPPFNKGNER